MNAKITLLLCTVFIVALSCNKEKKKTHAVITDIIEHQEEEKHWSYSGETSPRNWAEIEKNSDCDGYLQSPINIIHRSADSVKISNKFQMFYTHDTFLSEVKNDGHSIKFAFESGDSIRYKNDIYYLKQIHFHEPAEHKINGLIYPIEIHLVHQSKSGKYTVLGILGEEGAESDLFEFFQSFLPLENGETKEIDRQIDLSYLQLDKKHYYTYRGSLTTPPCTESVHWVVFKEPIILSVEEVLTLKSNMPINNYRHEQPLNGRVVKYNY